MKEFILQILTLLGAITLVLLVAAAGIVLYFRIIRKVGKKTIVELDLGRDFVEHLPQERMGRLLMKKRPGIRHLIEAMAKAARDPRVEMLVAKIGGAGMQLGMIQEIRDAVQLFRRQGKKAVVFAESFGEFGPGNKSYYLATAFDRIYLQPSGNVGLTGLRIRAAFLKNFLEKIGIEPRLSHRKEYKSAVYTFTESEYTPAHQKADRSLLQSMASQVVQGIAAARGLDDGKVHALMDKGPFSSVEALRENLVDELVYRDQVYDRAQKEVGEGARILDHADYLRRAGSPFSGKKKIAVIYCTGPIVTGKSRYSPMGRHLMGSDTLAGAFQEAAKDPSVQAIVFRINSPGGSYVASDAIWRATVQAKTAGKPVIVSMGEVAASGGYFVAAAADTIIAQPGTVTGSIGVISGKMITAGVWNRLGIHWGEIFTHQNAGMWSSMKDFSGEQWERIQSWLDDIYLDFLKKVADGRKMDMEKIRSAAKGRIWSGEDAKTMGLVDKLGGFDAALREARKKAGMAQEEMIGLKLFPSKPSLWDAMLARRLKHSYETDSSLKGIFEGFEAWLHKSGQWLMPEFYGVLQMPERMIE